MEKSKLKIGKELNYMSIKSLQFDIGKESNLSLTYHLHNNYF